MRPLYHPPISEITVQGILHALSDPVRAQIFSELAHAECAQSCSDSCELAGAHLPKSSLSQHFKILRESGLIRSERKGVTVLNQTRCEELNEKFGGLIMAILMAFKAESKSSPKEKTSTAANRKTPSPRKKGR